MSLDQQLERDRALRNAAWGVVSEDVNWLQADLEHRGVGGRVVDKVGEKAKDLAGQSLDTAKRNKLAVGTLAAGVVIWLARKPLARVAKNIWSDFSAARQANGESKHSEEQEA